MPPKKARKQKKNKKNSDLTDERKERNEPEERNDEHEAKTVKDDEDFTAVMKALRTNDVAALEARTAERAADLTKMKSKDGNSLLSLAVMHMTKFGVSSRPNHPSLPLIDKLIACGIDVNAVDDQGNSALGFALFDSHPSPHVLRSLIAAGADVNRRDNAGSTPLHYLAHFRGENAAFSESSTEDGRDSDSDSNSDDVLKRNLSHPANVLTAQLADILIQGGANSDIKDNKGSSPFDTLIRWMVGEDGTAEPSLDRIHIELYYMFVAASDELVVLARGDRTHAKVLLESCFTEAAMLGIERLFRHNCYFLQCESDGGSMAATASSTGAGGASGGVARARARARHPELMDVDALNEDSNLTALEWAVRRDHWTIALLLIEAGANVNVVSDADNGASPLLFAAEGGRLDVVSQLIAHGADVNYVNRENKGVTALYFAALFGHPDVVQALLSAGAKDIAVDGQVTALHSAANRCGEWPERAIRCMRILAAAGHDVTAVDTLGEDCLMKAAQEPSSSAVIDVLVELGCTTKHCSFDGVTALHMAAYETFPDNCRRLVKHNANVSARNSIGWTPLHTAAATLDPEVVIALLECKANPTLLNNNGLTPLQCVGAGPGGLFAALSPGAERVCALLQAAMASWKDSKCACCGGVGATGKKLLRCSRCKAVNYCDTECQKKHWHAHKPKCKK